MLRLYNSLTRKIEEFKPIHPPKVGMYACGPTVYNYPTIGNWRTYTTSDLLQRVLILNGFKVNFVMNITDVGHLTGDNLGDADTGEDRLEKAAKRERKNAWEIADFYTQDFLKGSEKLNLVKPRVFPKPTAHIKEQIGLVKKLDEKGFTYQISDGVYFNVKAYENAGHKYGELSTLDEVKEGARVEANPQKKDPRDFALWKFSPTDKKRDMEWQSPWGIGFPGWHIECSAMSMKYLGNQIDIHVGGEDLRSTHHPNEIAQSEAANNKKPFSQYWVHGAFLLVDGGRMGKSVGNAYTIQDIEEKGFDSLDLRYFYLIGHYRKQLNFTWQALEDAQNALNRLRETIAGFQSSTKSNKKQLVGCAELEEKFLEAVNNDLNMPKALAVVWEMVESSLPDSAKLASLLKFDSVLGLKLAEAGAKITKVPAEIKKLVNEREVLRRTGDYQSADVVREKIISKGFWLEDKPTGTIVKKL